MHDPAPPPPRQPTAAGAWRADRLLGPAFEERSLGAATLVRAVDRPDRPRAVVLHVHGYNDYFFQSPLAQAFRAAGYTFCAVDLRRAGRSLLDGGPAARDPLPPHYVASLREAGADLSAAARAARALEPGLPLVVHAHSTGGLTAALWAHASRHDPQHRPDLLVLDSPFLSLSGTRLQVAGRSAVLEVLGRRHPLAVVSAHPSVYAAHQHASHGGRWEFDTTLKRPEGLPARAGWLRTVTRAQARLARGLAVPGPVLVARSDSSGPDRPDNPRLDAQDTVLDVGRIAALAHRVGPDVAELAVPGGVHDLALSADGPRRAYLDGLLSWLGSRLPGVQAPDARSDRPRDDRPRDDEERP
ncbi:alpha/beta hydrolase [Krasilnikoviella flava]|uniref:Lysophospholipase, alpha-beta hydrolase superfamily n=1 Tax=Krasilnikoviella flava TaxID=526729 RepID=A0A1T5L5Q1_9MICO|nr:alpha/beta hydrolase [Krasilnikoviella flava]SKC71377.1 Lysophospholipase, alpha-beta hydrolase superfamily [Krasilnikoviella flava]